MKVEVVYGDAEEVQDTLWDDYQHVDLDNERRRGCYKTTSNGRGGTGVGEDELKGTHDGT